ncbi:hypothetical protein LR48_Vigan252s004600 [Vigna angularis]|uniref:DDE Tnp4 domain-containing protein n=1 Tax=Phaseolus angularis TaxID=3914 RepID=A0A0L9T8B0_PHAAN|nr:hypothetical protein LR48_Vigan252s004600 [Vigna angularis]
MTDIILACCILHNFLRGIDNDDSLLYEVDNELNEREGHNVSSSQVREKDHRLGSSIRDSIADQMLGANRPVVGNGRVAGLQRTRARDLTERGGAWRRVKRSLVLSPAGLAVARGDASDLLVTGRNCDGGRRPATDWPERSAAWRRVTENWLSKPAWLAVARRDGPDPQVTG